jgi:hypothetical protein
VLTVGITGGAKQEMHNTVTDINTFVTNSKIGSNTEFKPDMKKLSANKDAQFLRNLMSGDRAVRQHPTG